MASDLFGIVGATLAGAFRVEEVVAEGGFAVVYRAHHSGFRAPVALKCLKIPRYFSAEEQGRFQAHFHAEAELLFKLSASIPHVVRPLHVDAIVAPDGSFMPFMALEWLEGKTMDAHVKAEVLRGRAPSLSDLVELLTPVARALERAHNFPGAEGRIAIVHRDMKPENIFLSEAGNDRIVKILDFGIAKAKSMATEVGLRSDEDDAKPEFFTPAYGAPEQWLPARYGHTGPWTDVWGLALTMVELSVGRPVIGGDQAEMMGTALDPKRRPTPREEGLAVSDAVENVFRRALAVDPRERYPHAGAFWDSLVAALRGRVPVRRVQSADAALIPELVAPAASVGRVSGRRALPASQASAPATFALELDLPSGEREPVRREAAPQQGQSLNEPSVPLPVRVLPRAIPEPPPAPPTVLERFGPPLGLMAAGILVSVLDAAYAASTGSVFTIGPVRPTWLSALCVVSGVILLARRVFSSRDGV